MESLIAWTSEDLVTIVSPIGDRRREQRLQGELVVHSQTHQVMMRTSLSCLGRITDTANSTEIVSQRARSLCLVVLLSELGSQSCLTGLIS